MENGSEGIGDGSEMDLETKKKRGKNLRPVSVPTSSLTTGLKRRATTRCMLWPGKWLHSIGIGICHYSRRLTLFNN